VQFTLHTDPVEVSYQVAPALQAELASRLPSLQPRVWRLTDAEYISIELDGELAHPAPGVPGADEVLIAAAESVLPGDTALLIWFLFGDDRCMLLYWRFDPNDPFLRGGPVYNSPY
jgi:hypothetical protein